jgi:HEAT repeat protein
MVTIPVGQPTEQEIMSLRLKQISDVAAFAAGALGRLDARSALPLVLKSAEAPNDFFLRLVSVEILVAWNVPEALPVFVRRLADPASDVRVWALIGLERLGDQRAVGPVFASLSDQSVPVRARAVTTLAALGGSKVRPQLEALEQKELEPEVRAALETALSQLAR